MRVDPTRGRIDGDARIVLTARWFAGRSHQLLLFAAPTLVIDSARTEGRPLPFERHGDSVLVAVAVSSRSKRPARLDLTVYYHGGPKPPAFSMDPHGADPAASTYGLPYDARTWWATPGSTDAKADSADVVVTVPPALTAVSNGRLVSRRLERGCWTTYHWAERHPIYPDVMSLAIGPYAELRDSARVGSVSVPMRFYVFRDDSAKARADFAPLPRILAFFSQRLGPYPFADEKYGVAEFTTQSFREHQTIPSLGPRFVTGDRRNEWILAHELAHQWFGNSLSVRSWRDAWLNEGLATYAAMLWKEHEKGRAAYDEDIAAASARKYEGSLEVADSADVDHMFGATSFFKGALFMHALRELLGDERFFTALREYVAAHRWGLVSVSNLESAMERQCGVSLDTLFGHWIREAGPVAPPALGAPRCR